MGTENTGVTVYRNAELGASIRVMDCGGELWFAAMDICAALEIRSDTIPCMLDRDEYRKVDPHTIGVTTNAPYGITLISEPGLYGLILRSRKPAARAFKRWITHEVLPALRRTGAYGLTPQDAVLRLLAQTLETLRDATAAIVTMAPRRRGPATRPARCVPCDPCRDFFSTHLDDTDPDAVLTKAHFYAAYSAWAARNGHRKIEPAQLGLQYAQWAREYGMPNIPFRHRCGGKIARSYHGLRIVEG